VEAQSKMGKALTLIGMWIFINIVSLLVAVGAGAIDPNSDLLAANALLGSNDMIKPYTNNVSQSGQYWTYNNTLRNSMPEGSATGTQSTTSTVFPDWINSSLKWITLTVGVLLNIIGAPYSLLMWMLGGGALVAVIGIGLSIINLFILVNWIFGKVD
jgi:hypothetical protein